MSLKATRFQLIEIPITAAKGVGSRIPIPDQPQLRTQTNQVIVIQGMSAYDGVSNPFAPSGAPVITVAEAASCYLVLNVFGIETNLYIPFNELNVIQSADTGVQRFNTVARWLFNNITKVDWSKSYVQTGAGVSAGVSLLLGVWYYMIPDDSVITSPTPMEMPVVS